jgi:3'(2'), 5'-bisphosphate nucleotidase
MPPYDLERTVARDAARLAGKLCLAVRQEMLGNSPGANRIEKAGREPVTIADYGAQAVVLQHITHHFPNDGTIAEERAAEFDSLASGAQQAQVARHVGAALGQPVAPDEIRRWLDAGRDHRPARIWTVDPIDGTKGFLRGDQFAVAVALLVDGVLTVGALACPLLPFDPARPENDQGVVAFAVRGQGATLEPLGGGPARPLRVSPQADIRQARTVESVEAAHTDHSFSAQVLQTAGVGSEGTVRMDSQAKYAAIADGRAEIYLRNSRGEDYREKIWDHAAGTLIVEEAGGRVTDLDGRPLDFSLGERLEHNRGVLATNLRFHDALLEAIRA